MCCGSHAVLVLSVSRRPPSSGNLWMDDKQRAPRNRTLSLTRDEVASLRPRLLHLRELASLPSILDRTICQDVLEAARHLPGQFVDLLVLDPPYNLTKTFNQTGFKKLPL